MQGVAIRTNEFPHLKSATRQTTGDDVGGYNVSPQQKLMMHLCDSPPACGSAKTVRGAWESGRKTLANCGFATLRLLLSWFSAGS